MRKTPHDRRDQTVAALFGLWMIVGLFLDGWAHDNQKPESFFTPWHGVLYSGLAASAAFALRRAHRSRIAGLSWRTTLPVGHGLTLVALAVFAVGAVGDLVWHEVLGIEVGIEALLSPTHLLLLASGVVVLSAPVRAAWHDPVDSPALRDFLPVALATALLTALVAFFILYLSPFSNDAAGTAFERFRGQVHDHPSTDIGELQQQVGIASILLSSVVLAVPVAVLRQRWRTPPGTFTLVFGLLVLLFEGVAEFAQPLVALAGPIAGVVTDRLARRTVLSLWALCSAAVGTLWFAYFALYALDEGSVAWSAELWTGATFLGALLAAGVGIVSDLARPGTVGSSARSLPEALGLSSPSARVIEPG